jgi:hypothetical protein
MPPHEAGASPLGGFIHHGNKFTAIFCRISSQKSPIMG